MEQISLGIISSRISPPSPSRLLRLCLYSQNAVISVNERHSPCSQVISLVSVSLLGAGLMCGLIHLKVSESCHPSLVSLFSWPASSSSSSSHCGSN